MKKKTGLILAAAGAGAGFLAGRFVEKIVAAKDLVDRIDDMGGSDDLEDYLYDRYGETDYEDYEDYEDDADNELCDEDVEDDTDDEDENKTASVKIMTMSDEEFKKFIREL